MWVYPEIRTLGDIFTYYNRHDPGRIAFIAGGTRISYGEVEAIANQIANGLIASGVNRGDRVVFYGKNSADYFYAMFGAVKAGAIFVPMNWRLSIPELGVILCDCTPVFAFIEQEFAANWAAIVQEAGSVGETILIDAEHPITTWSDKYPSSVPKVESRGDDAAILLYTSGTTGHPKGVIHTHASLSFSRLCEHLEEAYSWKDGDLFLLPLPNFHLLGVSLSLQCLYNGVAISILRQFDPGAMLAAIASDRPTLLVLTPTMIQMLLDHPDAATTDFGSIRTTMYAGSPISLGLIKRALTMMPCQFMQFYGQTETSGPVSLLRPSEHDLTNESKLRSCGRPLPLVSLRIVDSVGNDLPDGQPGELLVRAPAAAGGYWNQPYETHARFRDGWYYTGDLAYRDEEGLYYIHDRIKDMIVSGGENIYSVEVESAVSLHPAVASVAVIGVPDERWGEAVKALVILREGVACAEKEIIDFCRTRLAAYKLPKSVEFLDEFPMTATGKISKKNLSAPYWAGMDRRVN